MVNMKILAIETSCDDTCIAIIEVFDKEKPQFKILSNIVSSQVEIHKKWGGVFPALAKREHQKNLVMVLKGALEKAKLLKKSKDSLKRNKAKMVRKLLEREEHLAQKLTGFLKSYKKPDIDLIAVTIGPGLEPCLWAGINFAKALTYYWNLSIIPVNHIEAHIFANFISSKSNIKNQRFEITFPAISLVVSGGHTQLILIENLGRYKILGETRDDAAGECFDKVARILGLGYPGGPAIAENAQQWKYKTYPVKSFAKGERLAKRGFNRVKLPRPMINTKDFDFSFSGLKTAVLYNFKNQVKKNQKSQRYIKEICKETQQAIIDVLLYKTKRAAKSFKAETIILGGGVVANKELRSQFKKAFLKEGLRLFFPEPNFSTDNAVMVAVSAYFNLAKTKSWKEIEANANQHI
jgi:N6-L-threonylcarbamoyladenine synthase